MAEFKLKQTAEEVQKAIDDASTPSDWNQTDSSAADFIKNKPFGDMPTGGDTLYWDGNTEGLEQFQSVAYKVSDAVPTMADFSNGAYIYTNTGEYMEVSADWITDDGTGVIIFDAFAVVYGELDGLPKGIYLMNMNGMYVSSFTIPGYTGFPVTKKMEEKYLPNNHTRFYYVGDDYLYSDFGVSKVTVEELKTAARKGLIIVQIGANSSMTCSPLDITILTNDVIEYGALTIWHDEFITLYTAEYTAS